jgi:hypothetical protein
MGRKARKFTYGGRRVTRENEIGFWGNLIGTCALIGVVSAYCIGYFIVVAGMVVGSLFGGWYLFSKLGLL